MKLFLCDKGCPCGLFSEMLVRLKQIGIEPEICDDDPEETYLDYQLPLQCNTIVEERRFNLDLFQGIADERRPCIVCCGRGYHEAHERVCEKCGEHLVLCRSCAEQGRMGLAHCPFCKVITQDENNSSKWKAKSIKDIIPELLAGHRTGMNLARLTKTLESVCGRKIDKDEISNALSRLVIEGTIHKKGQRRYGV
jgi:hypothetical protein